MQGAKRVGLTVLVAVILVVAVAGYFAARAVVGFLGPAWITSIALVEFGALGSAILDWRDAQLEIATKRRAWLVGHRTLVLRVARRAHWHLASARLLVPTVGHARSAAPSPREVPVATPDTSERAAS